jgi:hypothetical protein
MPPLRRFEAHIDGSPCGIILEEEKQETYQPEMCNDSMMYLQCSLRRTKL